ncbi:unnamed protein product, partial [Effrenium voratum]
RCVCPPAPQPRWAPYDAWAPWRRTACGCGTSPTSRAADQAPASFWRCWRWGWARSSWAPGYEPSARRRARALATRCTWTSSPAACSRLVSPWPGPT